MFYICNKLIDKEGKILGCMAVDIYTKKSMYIAKQELKKYKYVNAKISDDFKILSKYIIPTKSVKTMHMEKSNKLKLYHGSHSGLNGKIVPKSRPRCDFGVGFYTGNKIEQAEALISDDQQGVLYTLTVDISDLDVYDFDDDIKWALYVGVNRGRINLGDCPRLKEMISYINSKDLIIGLIADDRMMYVYSEFIDGNITDKALVECLKYVKLGKQYVFKTQTACDKIKILESCVLSEDKKKRLKLTKSKLLNDLPKLVTDVKNKYRRSGLYIDELLAKYR